MGDGDPNCKCKMVSGTKTVEQKLVGTLGHWVTGTLSASAKRSVEQKLHNKNSGTIIGGDSWGPKVHVQKRQGNKNWWEPLGTRSASAKRLAEQKLQNKTSGTKTAEQNQWDKNLLGDPQTLGDGDPKCKCKKGQLNKNSGIKISGDPQTLGDGKPKYKFKNVSGIKTVFVLQFLFCSFCSSSHPCYFYTA